MAFLSYNSGQLGEETPQESGGFISSLLAPIMPKVNAAITDPLVAKIKPAVKETLLEVAPTWGLWIGLGLGSLFILGVSTGLLTTKERRKARGR